MRSARAKITGPNGVRPLTVECPVCRALVGQPCKGPAVGRAVYHYGRRRAAAAEAPN